MNITLVHVIEIDNWCRIFLKELASHQRLTLTITTKMFFRRVMANVRATLFKNMSGQTPNTNPGDDVKDTRNSDTDAEASDKNASDEQVEWVTIREENSARTRDEKRPSFYPADLTNAEACGFMNMVGDAFPYSEEELEEWIEKKGLPSDVEIDLFSSIDDFLLEKYAGNDSERYNT